ncbi:MAG TPA: alkaline phosphatase family protein [Polyangia bacterium]|jgi:hypothetical protein|nr:alkaline phosphatase family protein [Polyangia bacterium]
MPPQATTDRHVLLISVDGMHQNDLEGYIASHTGSALAMLSQQGTQYRQARTPVPSDSFPGVLAVMTGGTPRSTGVYYDLSYDRRLAAPASDCSQRGTVVDFTESVDRNSKVIDGGGGLDESKLPRDPDHECGVVYPHQFLRVNTIFEVAKASGLRTAWSDKHLSYEIVNGPSGTGVDDLYNPEIAAKGITKKMASTEDYDDLKVAGLINQIEGKSHAGAAASVPALFGMNFQAVSVAQKSATGGYLDGGGTPSAELAEALDHTDRSIGQLVNALAAQQLAGRTTVVLTAVHGQSPVDPGIRRVVSTTAIPDVINSIQPGLLAAATQDDVALLWLNDAAKADSVTAALKAHGEELGIDDVIWGDDLRRIFADPEQDSRAPDIIVKVKPGVLYMDSKDNGKDKLAEHGGFSEDDRHVPLIVIVPGGHAAVNDDTVETRQIAPTVLTALRLDPGRLQAIQREPTAVLPGLGSALAD